MGCSPEILYLYFSEFLPGAGPLIHLSTPDPADDVRIDTGVEQGQFDSADKDIVIVYI